MAEERNAASAGYTVSDRFRCLENLGRSSNEVYLSYCGWEKNEPSNAFAPEARRNHVLHFVLEGKGTFVSGGDSFALSQGDIFYIAPGAMAGYMADGEEPWSYNWIGYNGVRAEEFSALAGFDAEHPVRHSEKTGEISRMIGDMLDAHSMSVPDDLHRSARLLEIFAILIQENAASGELPASAPQDPDFVEVALEYITQNFDKNIRISDLAVRLNVSRSYFSSSFKKAIGCSPQTFILNLRMERAKNLLRTTTLPVNVISDSVGYQDQLAFSKIFKQYFGVSPRDFRKSGEEVQVFRKKGDFDTSVL